MWLQRKPVLRVIFSGGSRKNIWGAGPSSLGRQSRLSEITIEPITWVYARNVASSSECWTLKARGSRRREAWSSWEECPLPSRLGDLGERRELPQRGPGQSPGRQRILGIFQSLRILLVETMHYGTNQNFGGGQDLGACAPWPQPKTATVFYDTWCVFLSYLHSCIFILSLSAFCANKMCSYYTTLHCKTQTIKTKRTN